MYSDMNQDNNREQISGENFVFYNENTSGNLPPNNSLREKPVKKSFFKTFIKTVCIALVFGLVAGGSFAGVMKLAGINNIIPGEDGKPMLNVVTPIAGSDNSDPTDVTSVVEESLPSVVAITNKSVKEIRTFFGNFQQEASNSGSGVIVGQNDSELLIVTNYHVIAGSMQLSVAFSFEENQSDINSGSIVSATVKGYDSTKDIAVISVKLSDVSESAKEKLKVATIGDSGSIKLGEKVLAIGNALGYGQSVTQGYISALSREITVANADGLPVTNKYLQTDAAINPGNSGGALLNSRGELIGINTVKVADSSVEGMGYAIPIGDVSDIIENMMVNSTRTEEIPEKDRGYLGIGGDDVTAEASQRYGMPMGVFVGSVAKGGAAEKAGIVKGNIITKLDSYTIGSMAELQERLKYYRAGETVEITVHALGTDGYSEKKVLVELCDRKAAGIQN